MKRIPCTSCENTILEETAALTGGICMPCKRQREREARNKIEVIPDPADEEYDRIVTAIEKRVADAINGECVVQYSVYDKDKNGMPIDNLDQIVLPRAIKLVQDVDPYWGDGENFTSQILRNPTWMDIAIAANEMILVTGDKQHCYLEGITYLRSEGSVNIYELDMGS